MSCGCPPVPCGPIQPCEIENFGLTFPSLVGPMGPPGGPGTYVENYDALRALDPTVFTEGYEANVGGHTSFNDGGTGVFIYASASVAADNDGTIIKPTVGPGAWLRAYNGPLYVDWFGAKGDGVTDDTAAIQAALDVAAGGAAKLSPKTYALLTELTYDSDDGPLDILGYGATLKATGANNRCLSIYGTVGVSALPIKKVQVYGILFHSDTSGTCPAGLLLTLLAQWVIRDCKFTGGAKMTWGIRCTAAQQGEISGCAFEQIVGGLLCELGTGNVGSNGIETHGCSFSCTAINYKAESIDTGFFHSNHLTSALQAIDISAVYGMPVITFNHIEPVGATNDGIIVRAGYIGASRVSIIGNTITGLSDDIKILTGTNDCQIYGNQINGNFTIDAGALDTLVVGNSTSGTCTDNGTRTRIFNNFTSAGTGFNTNNIYGSTTITSKATVAGHMLELKPNAAVAGNWGMRMSAIGGGDIYFQYGDVVVAGEAGGGVLKFMAGIGGALWGSVRSTGLRGKTVIATDLPVPVGAGEVGISGQVGGGVGVAGAGSALPATPEGYITVNVAGTNMVVPYYLFP